MRKFKKGFTIVELVIVIAVIAVLTAVLVPTFIHLTNKANRASDESLVTNLNKALAMREAEQGESGKNNTMYDAVLDLKEEGYLADRLVSKSDQKLLWSQKANRFFLEESYDPNQHGKDYNCFHVEKAIPDSQKWGIYAGPDWTVATVSNLKVSFDAGEAPVTSISYVRTEGTPSDAQDVVIRTNGGSLEVKAPADIVNHYGEASVVSIKKVATESYHLHGEVTVRLTVEDGRAVVEDGGRVATLEVAKGATEIVAASGSKVENLSIASDADIQSAKLQVESGSEVKVVVNNSTTVETTALVEAGVTVIDASEEAIPENMNAFNLKTGNYANIGTVLTSGNYVLLKDITQNFRITEELFGSNFSIDLNGHTITANDYATINCGRDRYAKSNIEITGEGKIVNLSTDSNAAVILIANGNLVVGPGVKLEGGSVGIFFTGQKNATTVKFAGQYTTENEHSFGFYRNGTLQDDVKCPTITIEKTAKIDVPDGAAIYAAGYAVWNIEGGEFTSNECLEFKSGVVTIQDGTFKTTASSKTHVPYSNGTSANGYALAIVWNDDYAKPLTVTLNGGKFVGPVALLCDEEDLSKVNNVVLNNNIGVAIEHEPQ